MPRKMLSIKKIQHPQSRPKMKHKVDLKMENNIK